MEFDIGSFWMGVGSCILLWALIGLIFGGTTIHIKQGK